MSYSSIHKGSEVDAAVTLIKNLSGNPVGTDDVQTITNKTLDPSQNTVNGDKLDISWDPSNYSPNSSIPEADDVDDLAAHLKGIDAAIATLTSTIKALVPAGSILAFASDTAPSGWLECDGSAYNRTTYADLFAEIGTYYGAGDGSTTFNVPDYRGYFLRGWDHSAGMDPDAASRTDRGDSTTGDNVGTRQADQNKSHNHTGPLYNLDSGAALTIRAGAGAQVGTVTTNASGGNEARPKNINVMYCIKT